MWLGRLLDRSYIQNKILLARAFSTSLPCAQCAEFIQSKKRKKYPLPTGVRYKERNIEKFPLTGKRESGKRSKYYERINYTGVQRTGVLHKGRFIFYKDSVPEIVVPDLTGFRLKPYVSYRVPDVVQSEFTSRDLFDAVYAPKIVKDYKEGQLDLADESKSESESRQ